MDLLKLSDRNYIPIHSITRISMYDYYMYVYYQRGTVEDCTKVVLKDGHTLEQELQSRLVNILPTKGPINAI